MLRSIWIILVAGLWLDGGAQPSLAFKVGDKIVTKQRTDLTVKDVVIDTVDRGRLPWSLRLQIPSRDPVRRLCGGANDHRGDRDGPGKRTQQRAGARLRHALRNRKHTSHDFRNGGRPVAQVTPPDPHWR